MKKLIIKSILTTVTFLLIVLMFIYNFIYNPLYETLEETVSKNFVDITETSKVSFEYIIERGIENSKSISSRTMIKEKIIEYKDGIVNLEQLKNFTQPKYIDGIQALEDVVYSVRIVDNNIIVTDGEKPKNINMPSNIDELSYEIFEESDRIYLSVYSPIKSNIILGIDIIVFDLSNDLKKIESEDISINIVKKDEMIKYKDETTKNPLISEHKDLEDIVYLNVFYEVYDDIFLHISTPKDIFYNKFNKIAKSSTISMAIVFVFSFIAINIIIILFASEKITSLDRSNRKHKRDSHYDALTGSFSRIYLDQWLKANHNRKLEYSIAFIDMNDFKVINDKYGHKKGDQVLRDVVLTIKGEIRENDFIVRFGGDEFIILLDNVSKENTIKIIKRINKNLQSLILLDPKVSFSYGVSELKNTDEFDEVLEKIDMEMYQMKRENKM